MDWFKAFLRLSRHSELCGDSILEFAGGGLAPCRPEELAMELMVQPGVRETAYEPTQGTLVVSFDRRLLSVADLVRLVEAAGAGVTGVSQCRDTAAAEQAQPA